MFDNSARTFVCGILLVLGVVRADFGRVKILAPSESDGPSQSSSSEFSREEQSFSVLSSAVITKLSFLL